MIRYYRNNFVFEDYLVNQLCDEIISLASELINKQNFMLTGLASYFLQRGVDSRPIKNVIFKTTDINVYNFLSYKIGELDILNLLKYDNRLLFQFQGSFQKVCFELWFEAERTSTVDLNNVICEEFDKIKEIML